MKAFVFLVFHFVQAVQIASTVEQLENMEKIDLALQDFVVYM